MADYEQFWYEEYSVLPYGKVVVKFKDEDGIEKTFAYVFDENAKNVYYMDDNYFFKEYKWETADIIECLRSYFIPNILNIRYVPIELGMRSKPYMEMGDVIRIVTRDDAVESFIFRRTISGIQNLFDDITSHGDEYNEDITDTSTITYVEEG